MRLMKRPAYTSAESTRSCRDPCPARDDSGRECRRLGPLLPFRRSREAGAMDEADRRAPPAVLVAAPATVSLHHEATVSRLKVLLPPRRAAQTAHSQPMERVTPGGTGS